MAHQPHNIPWHLVADDLEYKEGPHKYGDCANLYPRMVPGQGERWNAFGKAFAKSLAEQANLERQKYAESYPRPDLDDYVISKETALNIEKSVFEYRRRSALGCCEFLYPKPCPIHLSQDSGSTDSVLSEFESAEHGSAGPICNCGLSDDQRKARYWLLLSGDCFRNENDCLELLNTLLLHGEMEPLFRVATMNGRVSFRSAEEACGCHPSRGWGLMLRQALAVYISFNLLYCKTELWPSQHDKMPPNSPRYDYRRTAAYQQSLIESVDGTGQSHQAMHCLFHGIIDGEISHIDTTTIEGPDDSIGAIERYYVPHTKDISEVFAILFNGTPLPAELCLSIMKLAEYDKGKRKIIVIDDPLHPDNKEELVKYLDYCWSVLIRFDMLLRALGKFVDWQAEAAACIWELFLSRGNNMGHLRQAQNCEDLRLRNGWLLHTIYFSDYGWDCNV